MREKLKEESKNQQIILDDVNYRVEWGKYQERIKKQQQEKVEKVGQAFWKLLRNTKVFYVMSTGNNLNTFRNALHMQKSIGMISSLLKLLIFQHMKEVICLLQ